MSHHNIQEGVMKWKVNNPTSSNHIVQMRSQGFQPPFYLGGSQVPSTLGIQGNSNTADKMPSRKGQVSRTTPQ
jgi:hypothetical protein